MISERTIRLALGMGMGVLLGATAATITLIVLFVNSNQHAASMDKRMASLERQLFPPGTLERARADAGGPDGAPGGAPPAGPRPAPTMKGAIDAVLPTLNGVEVRLRDVIRNTAPVKVLPSLNEQIGTIGQNTNAIGVLPQMSEQLDALPVLLTQIEALRGQLAAVQDNTTTINELPGMARSVDQLSGRIPSLHPIVEDVDTVARRIPPLGPLVRNLARLERSLVTVPTTLATLTEQLKTVAVHVANIDRKFPGTPQPPVQPGAQAETPTP